MWREETATVPAVAAAAATHAELEVELHGRNLIAFKKFVEEEDYSSASISWPNRSAKVWVNQTGYCSTVIVNRRVSASTCSLVGQFMT